GNFYANFSTLHLFSLLLLAKVMFRLIADNKNLYLLFPDY
ncbi:hypothetical protein FDUTEX481_02250, partial [Tolypothrix sp. PCC 7601]